MLSVLLLATFGVGVSVATTPSLSAFATCFNLGSAANFAILCKWGISNVPDSHITGDIGVSPIAGSAITGFSLSADPTNTVSTSTQVTGFVKAADFTLPTSEDLTKAINDMETAYNNAELCHDTKGAPLMSTEAGGPATFVPGVYTFDIPIDMTKGLIFDAQGDVNAFFGIRTTKDVYLAEDTEITLTNGARTSNIFWQVAGSVAVGKGAHFVGTILAKKSVTFKTGSRLDGRIFSQAVVALQRATVKPAVSGSTSDECSGSPAPTPRPGWPRW